MANKMRLFNIKEVTIGSRLNDRVTDVKSRVHSKMLSNVLSTYLKVRLPMLSIKNFLAIHSMENLIRFP